MREVAVHPPEVSLTSQLLLGALVKASEESSPGSRLGEAGSASQRERLHGIWGHAKRHHAFDMYFKWL